MCRLYVEDRSQIYALSFLQTANVPDLFGLLANAKPLCQINSSTV